MSATAYVKKLAGGQWHVVAATAHYSEYVQKKKDGGITSMWLKPHIMLGKCAEALALRRAFPAELSGVYTPDEMAQAANPEPEANEPIKGPEAKKDAPKVQPADGVDFDTFIPVSSTSKPDKNGKERFAAKSPAGLWYSTYDDKQGTLIQDARVEKFAVKIGYTTDGDFQNIVSVEKA